MRLLIETRWFTLDLSTPQDEPEKPQGIEASGNGTYDLAYDDRVHRPTDLPDRDQLLRAQAWVEAHTDDPDEVREIMQMLAGPMGRNSQP